MLFSIWKWVKLDLKLPVLLKDTEHTPSEELWTFGDWDSRSSLQIEEVVDKKKKKVYEKILQFFSWKNMVIQYRMTAISFLRGEAKEL